MLRSLGPRLTCLPALFPGPVHFCSVTRARFPHRISLLDLNYVEPPPHSAGTTTVLLNTLGSTLPPITRGKNQSSPGRQAVLGFHSHLSFLRGSLWQLSAAPGSPGRPGGVGEELGYSQGREGRITPVNNVTLYSGFLEAEGSRVSLGLSALEKERTGCSFGLFFHRSRVMHLLQARKETSQLKGFTKNFCVLPAAEAKGVTLTVTPVSEGEGMSPQTRAGDSS